MIFNWRNITETDFEILNKWHAYAYDEAVKQNKLDNITKYLSDPVHTEPLGNIFKEIIGFDEDIKGFIATKDNTEIGAFVVELFSRHNVNMCFINMYVVNPKMVGCGYGTALMLDLIKNREQILGKDVKIFSANVEESNTASLKILKKAKFTLCNERKKFKFDKYMMCVSELERDNALNNVINEVLTAAVNQKQNVIGKKR